MQRSMMQVVVKGSAEALALYRKAFDAKVLCEYSNEDGSYCHAELDVYGQVVALTELTEEVVVGNTMMFCFHLGKGSEDDVRRAYDVLREDAISYTSIGPCDYSSCQFVLTDKFGVCWCVFV